MAGSVSSENTRTNITISKELKAQLEELAKKEGVTERLKTDSQMEWVGRMNNLTARAREIVNNEIIYT